MNVAPLPLSAPADAALVRALAEPALVDAQRAVATERRRLDAWAAVIAGEIARRSDPAFGHAGLSQRAGARTPARMVQQLTGVSQREADALVRVGTSSLSPVADAIAEGTLSVAAADAIVTGLGDESPAASGEELAAAAVALIDLAATTAPEQLVARAREARAEIDEQSIADLYQERRARRYLRLSLQPDGMTRVHGLLDPESATVVRGVFDSLTSPRRGGPRFVFPGDKERADAIENDPRTTDQLVVDGFVQICKVAAAADPGMLLPPGPAVRVLVTARDLCSGIGPAYLEGQAEALPVAALGRYLCESGIQPALFDASGRALDLGRTQRLFTARQRAMLAARDGGCRYPGCNRPANWCEAHHIDPFALGGRTDVRDGILLCRHHHLVLHDNGWAIRREGEDYWLIPPPDLDPGQVPRAMPARSPVMRRLLAS